MPRCRKCGWKTRRKVAFCGRCGSPLKRRRWPLALAIVAAIVVLLGVGGLALWRMGLLGGETSGSGGTDQGGEGQGAVVVGVTDGDFVHLDAGVIEDQVTDEDDALGLIVEIGTSLGITDPEDTLADPSVQDALGNSFYRFGQVYEGIPVYGRAMIIGAGEQGDVIGVTGNYLSVEGVATTPVVSSEEAAQIACEGHDGATVSAQELCVYSLNDVDPTLAWQVDIGDGLTSTRVFVDASTGEVVTEGELSASVTSVTATGADGTDIVLAVQDNGDGTVTWIDESRNIRCYFGDNQNVTVTGAYLDEQGNEIEPEESETLRFEDESGQSLQIITNGDYTFDLAYEDGTLFAEGVSYTNVIEQDGERLTPLAGAPSLLQSVEYRNLVSLYGYLVQTVDFYKINLNRNSYNGYWGPIDLVSDVHFSQIKSKNALTYSSNNGSMICYGDELSVARVIVAHEFTHSVIYIIAGLESDGELVESGALNEAICDLMGMVVDDYANDREFDNDGTWEMPEMRNLADPDNSNGGRVHLPAAYGDENWNNGNLDIHHASTVISHAGYLMCNDDSLEGESLTTEQLGKLLYVTLFSIPADCTFSQFRVIMENACTAMIEQGLLNPAQRTRVSAAFDEVNVGRCPDLYGLTEDATLQVFDANNQPYGDYVAYVGPWKANYSPSPGDEDVYTINPTSSEPVSLEFPSWGRYEINVGNLGGLEDGEEPYEYWSASVCVGFWNESDELKMYTSFSELDEESTLSAIAGSLPENDEGDEASSPSASGARDVVLVLDVSGSMAGNPISQLKTAAKGFVDTALDGGAQVGLVSYSDEAEVLEGLSSSFSVLVGAIDGLETGGKTNIEDGLVKGGEVLSRSEAEKPIYVLMSDGVPNLGKTGDELVAYADDLKSQGSKIYTVGFDEGAEGYALLSQMASDGCHYEVSDVDDLAGFFSDIADEISGTRFLYARVACPVDVEVSYGGETLSSSVDGKTLRTSFGTIAFEDEVDDEGNVIEENGIKVLRLREGPAYDIEIVGTGEGEMDYTLGLANEDGDYEDFRLFESIAVTPSMRARTTAEATTDTRLEVDEDGDGSFDIAYVASANETARKVDNHLTVYLTLTGCVVATVGSIGLVLRGVSRSREARRGRSRAA